MLISHWRNPPARADLAVQAGCRRSRLIRPSPSWLYDRHQLVGMAHCQRTSSWVVAIDRTVVTCKAAESVHNELSVHRHAVSGATSPPCSGGGTFLAVLVQHVTELRSDRVLGLLAEIPRRSRWTTAVQPMYSSDRCSGQQAMAAAATSGRQSTTTRHNDLWMDTNGKIDSLAC